MPRHRKSRPDLPAYVYLSKGRYVHRAYQDGKLGRETVLAKADAPLSEVWRAYEAIQHGDTPRRDLRWLFRQYLASADFQRHKPTTRHDYHGYARRIGAVKLRNGAEFGAVALDAITPGVLRRYVDRRTEDAPVSANRELAFLSVAFGWAFERDLVRSNPAKGVSRNPEKHRDRYVRPEEYLLVYTLAGQHYPYLQPIMELAYLCRLRLAEVLDLTRADLQAEGIHCRRRKGSRDNLTIWTPRLRAAVDLASALPRPAVPLDPARCHIIPSRDTGRLRESTVQTAWQRLMPLAQAAGLATRFTLHDLKAAGITDTDRADQLAASGHRDPRMLNTYDRLPQPVKPSGK